MSCAGRDMIGQLAGGVPFGLRTVLVAGLAFGRPVQGPAAVRPPLVRDPAGGGDREDLAAGPVAVTRRCGTRGGRWASSGMTCGGAANLAISRRGAVRSRASMAILPCRAKTAIPGAAF